MKKPALQNKQVEVLRMAFRPEKFSRLSRNGPLGRIRPHLWVGVTCVSLNLTHTYDLSRRTALQREKDTIQSGQTANDSSCLKFICVATVHQ